MSRFDICLEITPPRTEESSRWNNESPEHFTRRLSLEKATGVAQGKIDTIVLAADTIVVLNNEILGKPEDTTIATDMLRRLRGTTHKVITGISVINSNSMKVLSSSKTSVVIMRPYSDTEIKNYVESKCPFDKAGGYGIQDKNFHPVHQVLGCYLNVVGLPLCQVTLLLKLLGVYVNLKQGWDPPGNCAGCEMISYREEVYL